MKEKIIKQIVQFLESEHLTVMNVCFFMQQIRILIEIAENKKKYSIANHYCNWLLHSKLDRSNSPVIIDDISESLLNVSTKNELIKNINNVLSLKKLVTEIKEILWENIENKKTLTNSNIYFLDDYWVIFLKILLNQILFRPLLLPNNNTIALEKYRFNVKGIHFVTAKDKVFLEVLSNELNEKDKKILIEIVLFKDDNVIEKNI
jgi:hypothetical protein